jgi:Protein of unknown function (DUF2914)/Tetratricopeptide repeat
MESAEARPILAAAEAAAAVGDYGTAERLLREAAAVQERSIGAAHPDLANTFNNLGVVCERAGKLDDAEACYRRAYAIVTSAFPADHPFVETSRQNLEEFCAANGRSIDADTQEGGPTEPVTAGPVEQVDAGPGNAASKEAGSVERAAAGPNRLRQDSGRPPQLHAKAEEQGPADTAQTPPIEPQGPAAGAATPMRLQLDPPPPLDARSVASAPAGPTGQRPAHIAPATQPAHTAEPVAVAQRGPERPSRALPLGALAVLGVSFAIVLVGLMAWPSRTTDDAPTGAESSSSAPAETTAAAPSTERAPASAPSAPPAVTPDRGSPNTTASGLTLTDARLCRTLSTREQWECTPLGDPATPGPMVFFTRIVAPRPTTVEHRWYFGDRLEQSVSLDIQPNSSGYRTFSRRTSNARLAGPWRVELRNQDGELLREERFTVSK